MVLGMEVCLIPGDFVLDGDPVPPHQFSTHVYCVRTAAWIKMPLGTEVGLSPDDIVLDDDPVLPPLKGTVPYFRPMSVVPKRLDGLR